MDEAVKSAAVPDQYNEESTESEVLLERASGAASENVGPIDEEISTDAITDQRNK